ncbi:MAG TPA: 3-oxoacyl-ACP reductase family protein [Myxococcota bacterium]|nr:3-oxoacyl-ACP reductase family protein [Myxococcota bacterium]
MGTLSGKVALVTGASRGIGAAIATRLAREGADVAITYAASPQRAEEVTRAVREAGGRALALRADAADPAAVQAAVDEVARALGRLDVLVNNAGIAIVESLEKFTLADFDRMVAINVRSAFAAAQAAARHLREGGRIVTIGSVNAERMPFAGGAVYAMTKAAIVGLTKGLARDLGPRGITVNNVQPGPIDTEMNPAQGDFAESLKRLMALPRYGQPADVASMVAYLVGPEAGFVTGASFTVDGGFLS